MSNHCTPVTARIVDGRVVYRPELGPGATEGRLPLGILLKVPTNARSGTNGLVNGNYVMETSDTTTLGTTQRNRNIGSAAGGVFSLRLVFGLLQAIVSGLSLITRSLNAGQRIADPSACDWRPGRYATDVDSGGPSGPLTRSWILISGIPRKTAAILSKAAVFLWAGVSPKGFVAITAPGSHSSFRSLPDPHIRAQRSACQRGDGTHLPVHALDLSI